MMRLVVAHGRIVFALLRTASSPQVLPTPPRDDAVTLWLPEVGIFRERTCTSQNISCKLLKRLDSGLRDCVAMLCFSLFPTLTLQRHLSPANFLSAMRAIGRMIFLLYPRDQLEHRFDLSFTNREQHLNDNSKLRYSNRRCFFSPI